MAVLPKPFEPDELVSMVNSCLSSAPTDKTPDTTQ
jgi:DNA-binding response OmpR family regulator